MKTSEHPIRWTAGYDKIASDTDRASFNCKKINRHVARTPRKMKSGRTLDEALGIVAPALEAV